MKARPVRAPTRWDDKTCGVPGCPCAHDPDGWPAPCDRGDQPAGPRSTTPGARSSGGAQITTGVTPGPDAVRKCEKCRAYRERRARERTD